MISGWDQWIWLGQTKLVNEILILRSSDST